MARWLPSAWGVAPTPMKAPGLISARLALTTPYIAALSVSFTFTSPASPALTVSVEPSTASIGPGRRPSHRLDRSAQAHPLRLWRRCGRGRNRRDPGCARQQAPRCSTHVDPPKMAACRHQRTARTRQNRARLMDLHGRRDAVAADRDGGGFERAVVLLVGGSDEDLRARLEFALVTGDVGHDHRLRRDHDLLF